MSIWTKLFGKQEVPKEMSAQDSIPFERMFPDGICRVKDGYYTKTIQFTDINYQLAQQEDKTAIFEEWCSFLNFFDSSISFELTFLNCSTDAKAFARWIRIPFKKDRYNSVRFEYSGMLKEQMDIINLPGPEADVEDWKGKILIWMWWYSYLVMKEKTICLIFFTRINSE